MKLLQKAVLIILLQFSLLTAEEYIIYLQPNTTQLFTELYQAYGLLNPPQRTFFESALYLDQSTQPSLIPMQPSNQAIFDHADQVLREFHTKAKDLELYVDLDQPKPFFYTATGSKHLIVALVYAIAKSEPDKKFVFIEQAPLYSGHPNAVRDIFNYPNARFLSFHDPSEIQLATDEVAIEIVTSPNNPDGKFRKPVTDAKIIIADFVFASSAFGKDGTGYISENIDWIRKARRHGKHVFSFNSASKQFGKTGTRCGYIWYPIYDEYAASIFKNFFGFISSSTVAGSSTGLEDFLNLIKALLDQPDIGKSLRSDAYRSLAKRHELVEKELLRRYPGSIVTSIPGSPTLFAKIKDKRIPDKKASDVFFEDFKVVMNNGEPMGESNEFVRLNLSGYSVLIAEFLNRMAGENKYNAEEVLFLSQDKCPSVRICAGNAPYIIRPGECFIEADASKGTVKIALPPFIGFLSAEAVRIKKVDSSKNQVIIKSADFTKTLNQQDQVLKVQWSQPNYRNGQWKTSD